MLYLYDFSVAKKAWKSIVSTYFRTTKRKSIRKIDFPKLLNDLYERSITTATVTGGFRNAGTWPHNPDAMKHKVVRRRSSQSQINTNNSSAMNILASLTNIIQTVNIPTNNSTDSSDLIQNNTNSVQSSSRRIRTFDDPDSDQRY
ncbi:unnamed protein product, partial [Rotaria sp. Silwood2]